TNTFWGSFTGPTTPANPGGNGDKIIDPDHVVRFVPFRNNGADSQPGTPGFQPSPQAPPVRAILTVLVSRKVGKQSLLFVRVTFADTGALKAEVRSPFQKPTFHAIAAAAFDSDGDGVADAVRRTAKRGKKTLTRLIMV